MADLHTPKPILKGGVTDLDLDGPTTDVSTTFIRKRHVQKGDSNLVVGRGGISTPNDGKMEVL